MLALINPTQDHISGINTFGTKDVPLIEAPYPPYSSAVSNQGRLTGGNMGKVYKPQLETENIFNKQFMNKDRSTVDVYEDIEKLIENKEDFLDANRLGFVGEKLYPGERTAIVKDTMERFTAEQKSAAVFVMIIIIVICVVGVSIGFLHPTFRVKKSEKPNAAQLGYVF